MRNKILLVIVIILALTYCWIGSRDTKTTSFFSEEQNIAFQDQQIIVKDTELETKKTMDVETYLIGVVAAEMPASFNYEALKAQAVAARTYAYYKIKNSNKDYDITTDTSSQAYIDVDKMKIKWKNDFDKYYEIVSSSVRDTKNQVITYDNEVISAYYFSMGNGKTENSMLVFGENKSYLQSVDSYDGNLVNSITTIEIPKKDFCQKLSLECNEIEIKDIVTSSSGRIESININNKKFTGVSIRNLLGLKSTDFTIQINETTIQITTKGYGHGVGMSQYGANSMANSGYSYKEILKHYYINTEIVDIKSII